MKNISLDGKLFSKEIFEDLKIKFEKKSINQKLAIVLVGNNPESITYCNLKEKKCKEINLPCKIFHFNEDISQENLEIEINKIANDSTFVGMMIQHPIPKHLNEQNCFNLIPVEKDVDGLSNNSLGLLAQGKELFLPATVLGIIKLLERYNIDVVSKKILIIGKSQIVGKPLALKLLNMGATVTVAHSKTKNLNKMIKNYEIVYNAFANTFLRFAKERVSYYGKNNLLSQKDFMDIEKIKKVAQLLENTNIWKSFDNNEEGINVSIGNENKLDDLSDISVVSTKLKVNKNNMGSVCVIGPTRMDYNQVIEALEFLSNKLEELENEKKEGSNNE